MRLDDLTEEELKELEKYEYENEGVFKKIANIFKKKKNVDVVEEYDDIPPVKETFRERLTNKIGKAKTARKTKKKEKKSLRDRFKEFKDNRKAKKATNKKFIKSLALTVFSGTLNLLSIGATLVAASSFATIGVVPAILISGLFVGAASITHCVFESEFDNFAELYEERKNSKSNEESDIEFEEIDSDELAEEEVVEKSDDLSDDVEYEDVLDYREIKDEEIEPVSEVKTEAQPKILKTKLTREEKIGKIKEFGIGHDSKLGIYCVPVPKDEKILQRFIREEYKKEYPEEKVQSFDTENEKVMVFKNKPAMFRK